MIFSSKQITNVLIRLRGCACWSVPLLFANPWRLSHRGPYKPSPENACFCCQIHRPAYVYTQIDQCHYFYLFSQFNRYNCHIQAFNGWFKYYYQKQMLSTGLLVMRFIWAWMGEKLPSGVCEQQWCIPDCTSAQTDLHLCYSLIGRYHI